MVPSNLRIFCIALQFKSSQFSIYNFKMAVPIWPTKIQNVGPKFKNKKSKVSNPLGY